MINTLQSLVQLHIYQLTASPECPFPNLSDGRIHFNMCDISWNIICRLPCIKEGLVVAVHDGIGFGTVILFRFLVCSNNCRVRRQNGFWWRTDEARPLFHQGKSLARKQHQAVSSERRPFFGGANAVPKSSSWLSLSSFMADDVIILDQSAASSSSTIYSNISTITTTSIANLAVGHIIGHLLLPCVSCDAIDVAVFHRWTRSWWMMNIFSSPQPTAKEKTTYQNRRRWWWWWWWLLNNNYYYRHSLSPPSTLLLHRCQKWPCNP